MSRAEAYAPYAGVVRKPSAFGTLFKSVAAVIITGIVCGTGIVIHAVNTLDGKAGEVVTLAGKAMENLPDALKDAAPILADATKDRRDPAYAQSMEVRARLLPSNEAEASRANGDANRKRPRSRRGVVEITNRGSDVVSVLALRVVSLDASGDPIADDVVYGATPLAIEDEWRGPLFSGTTRRIPVRCTAETESLEVEIAELRVWESGRQARDIK